MRPVARRRGTPREEPASGGRGRRAAPLYGHDPRLLSDDRRARGLPAAAPRARRLDRRSRRGTWPVEGACGLHGGAQPGYAGPTVALRPEDPVGRGPELERLGEILDDLERGTAM